MTGLADFDINGTPPVDGNGDRLFVATPGQLITCTLSANPGGVLSVRFDLVDPTNTESPLASKDAPLVTWVENALASQLLTGINDDATFNMPGADVHSYIIRCTVSTANGPVVFERIVSTLSLISLLRKTIPTESVQAHARGVSDDLNDLVDAVAAALTDPTLKPPEAFAPAGTYPVTYDGGAVSKGDTFRMTGAGTMGAVTVNPEDLLIALADVPAQVDASWMVVESNRDQATESNLGVAKLATQVETDAGTNDTNIVTPLKLATAPSSSDSRSPSGSAGGQLGGTYPNPTVNAGADGTAIHDNVQGEIAAVAAGTVASGDLLLMEDIDDSNNKKKVTAQAIADLAGGTFYSAIAAVDDGDDGGTIAIATLSINVSGPDFGMKLPPTAGLSIGDRCFTLNASEARFLISVDDDGTEAILGLGQESGGASIATYGLLAPYVFEYMGTGLGQPFWLARSLSKDDSKPPIHLPVTWATTEALPAATASGADHDLILTGDANGQLVIDGVPVTVGSGTTRSLLVKNETGGLSGNNGVYRVQQPGSGIEPFILRIRDDWFQDKAIEPGTIIQAIEGRANAGKTFLLREGQDVFQQDPADFKQGRAVGTGDEGIDESKTTVNATSQTFFVAMPVNDTVAMVAVRLLGQDGTSNALNRYVDELTIKRDSGGTITSAVEVIAIREDQAAAALTYAVVAGGVNISILGVAGQTIEWRCIADIARLTLGGG